jgi:TonB family protein
MFGEIIEKKSTPKLVKKEVQKLHDDKISDLKKTIEKKRIEHHDHHYEDQDNIKSQNHKILHRPLPQIPRNMRREAFATKAVAKFYVNQDGSVQKIELLKAASNPRLNFLLMKELKKWQFEAAKEDFEVEVNVGFEVK